ncbi:MAG: HNH endonuclease signature motif containing protein [Chloroflexota bacterium]
MTYVASELRRLVIERAGNCCEYCRLSQEDVRFSFHIEHIIAEKHRGQTISENLCLSCPNCNGFKGSDISSVDWDFSEETVPLFNPRRQQWTDHFRLNGAYIEPLTPEGRVTVFLLKMNDPEHIVERELLIQLDHYPCNANS